MRDHMEQSEDIAGTELVSARQDEFSSLGLARKAAFFNRLSRDRLFGIPPSLDNVGLTEGERHTLQALHVRNSWLGDAHRETMARLRNMFVVASSLTITATIGLAAHFQDWSISGVWPIGANVLIMAALWWRWRSISMRWTYTPEDWDIRLKASLERLDELFLTDIDTLSRDLVDIQSALEGNHWLDNIVWQQLGPHDSLGMMRLTDGLEALPDTVEALDFDGDTHELVSRVADIANQLVRAERKVTISAMKGITEQHGTGYTEHDR